MVTADPSYTRLCARNDDTTGKWVRDPMLPHGLRTVDGSFNNLEFNTEWGSSNRLMPRMLPIDFRQAEPWPQGAPPNPRKEPPRSARTRRPPATPWTPPVTSSTTPTRG